MFALRRISCNRPTGSRAITRLLLLAAPLLAGPSACQDATIEPAGEPREAGASVRKAPALGRADVSRPIAFNEPAVQVRTDDRPTFLVTSVEEYGDGSLQDAVAQANGAATGAMIAFDLPGSGVRRIPISAPIELTTPTSIDGCTQPGADCSTWPPTLVVELNFQATAADGGLGLPDRAEVHGLSLTGMKMTHGVAGAIVMKGAGGRLQGNFIGVRPDGVTADGNLYGVVLNGVGNLVGSDLDGHNDDLERNLISGNSVGIYISQELGATRISGNYIGTDASGTVAVPNDSAIFASGQGIGLKLVNNLISGNEEGLTFQNRQGTAEVLGNYFGTDRFGGVALPNKKFALLIDGSVGLQIGGDGPRDGNLIAFNGSGILVEEGEGEPTSVRISHNTMYSNEGLSIDLNADGVTRNDFGDADIGPNRVQNYPEISSSVLVGGTVTLTYRVPSDPASADYPLSIEFYRADAGGDEGAVWLGTDTYQEIQAGQFRTVSFSPAAGVNEADRIIATATDVNGNTSEFTPPDQDGDGYPYTNDCNDEDSEIHPGGKESCDETDSNCDGSLVDKFTDSDRDGQPDCMDPDDDGDGAADSSDNCPLSDNPSQADLDQDGEGDVCDRDVDGDLTDADQDCDDEDPTVTGLVTYYPDVDGDGQGAPGATVSRCDALPPAGYAATATDNCPDLANPDQLDVDGNGVGDACETTTPTPGAASPEPSPSEPPDDAGGCACTASRGSRPLPLSFALLSLVMPLLRRSRKELRAVRNGR